MDDGPVGFLFYGGTHTFIFALIVTSVLVIVLLATSTWLYIAIRCAMARPFGKGPLGTILLLAVFLPWLGAALYLAFGGLGLGRRRVVDRKEVPPNSKYIPGPGPTSPILWRLVVPSCLGLFLFAGLATGQAGESDKKAGDLALDFGESGVVTSNPSHRFDWARVIAIDSSFMYVVGSNYVPGPSDVQWWIEKRSLEDGSLDPDFGIRGEVTNNPSEGRDSAFQIAIDSSFMYVVGTDQGAGSGQWRIEKRSLKDGALDAAFGTGGVVTSDPTGSKNDGAYGVAIDSSFMYVIGIDQSAASQQWRIEKRKLTNGSLDPEFGAAGVVTSDPSPNHDGPNYIAIDTSFMYVGGYAGEPDSPDTHWRIEKRSLADGSVDTGFGTAGAVSTNPSANDDALWESVQEIALDSTYLYVIGPDLSLGISNMQWRIEKRRLKDGSLHAAFGKGGVVLSNPSEGADHAWSMAIDAGFLYVVGFEEVSSPSDRQWRIEKRYLEDGRLDPGFGNGGAVTSNADPLWDMPRALAIDSSFLYVVGHDQVNGKSDRQLRIQKRWK